MRQASLSNYCVKLLPLDEYGDLINGTWNGYLGHLERNELDLIVGSFFAIQERLRDFGYVWPFQYV